MTQIESLYRLHYYIVDLFSDKGQKVGGGEALVASQVLAVLHDDLGAGHVDHGLLGQQVPPASHERRWRVDH